MQHLINSPISCQSMRSFPSSLLSSLWENQYSESAISIMLYVVLKQILNYAACSWKICYPHECLDDFVKNTFCHPCSSVLMNTVAPQYIRVFPVPEFKGDQHILVSSMCNFPSGFFCLFVLSLNFISFLKSNLKSIFSDFIIFEDFPVSNILKQGHFIHNRNVHDY